MNRNADVVKLDFLRMRPGESIDAHVERVRAGVRELRKVEGSEFADVLVENFNFHQLDADGVSICEKIMTAYKRATKKKHHR